MVCIGGTVSPSHGVVGVGAHDVVAEITSSPSASRDVRPGRNMLTPPFPYDVQLITVPEYHLLSPVVVAGGPGLTVYLKESKPKSGVFVWTPGTTLGLPLHHLTILWLVHEPRRKGVNKRLCRIQGRPGFPEKSSFFQGSWGFPESCPENNIPKKSHILCKMNGFTLQDSGKCSFQG